MIAKTHCSGLLFALVAGCAEGAPVENGGGDDVVDARAGEVDASGAGDDEPDAGEAEGTPDAGVIEPGDPDAAPPPVDAAPAPVDAAPAPVDAAPSPVDAMTCGTTQLLQNPAFDEAPIGVRWTQSPVAITNDAPVTPHTAPSSLWLGGYNNRTENVYQAVTVPAGITSLDLIVKYQVVNPENNADVYDTATLTVRSSTGTVLHTLRQWNNTDPESTVWEAATFSIPTTVAGQQIRIHFAGRTDLSAPSSFQFDSLELNATVCP